MVALQDDTIFTASSVVGLLGGVTLYAIGHISANLLLPKSVRRVDRYIYIWLVFDGLLHLSMEGCFLYTSTSGRTALTGKDFPAQLWAEYAKADVRWGHADPTVVALEILTVVIGGPLALYCAWLLMQNDMSRHPWLLILSTGELYGGWMTFCPEWLTGSPNLRTDNFLHLWVYLTFLNGVWVAIPLAIMVDSYQQIMKAITGRKTTPGAVAAKKSR